MTAHLEDVAVELRRTRAERDEAIAQQAAIAEVLQVINDLPGDIPIERATKFITIVNLKTAKALGLDIPPRLLASANEVIE